MSTATVAAKFGLARGLNIPLDEVVGKGTTQLGAWRLCRSSRVTAGAASSGVVLPSILSGEASVPVFVVNESGSTILVYTENGEKMDGSLNGNRSLSNGTVGVFFPDLNFLGGTTDWRSNSIA